MKKKLKLQIETLRVEQFETHPGSLGARGTVRGLVSGSDTNSIGPSAPWKYCAPVQDTFYSCEPYICE
jgi:hypothetical protein